jgi:hypothetical protein
MFNKIMTIQIPLLVTLLTCTSGLHTDKLNTQYLQGIWAENEEANALFEIRNDSLYNFEHFDQGFSYTLKDSVWIIHYEGVETNNIILKLSIDSLIYTTENRDTIRLYKR